MAPLRQALFATLLVFFCVFFSGIAADLAEKREPQGPLGVRLDYALATRVKSDMEVEHQWAFSTHLTFKNQVTDITNGQLRKLAADAYKEMEVDIQQYLGKNKVRKLLPGVMTVMAFGNEVILSSSQKGSTAFINEVADSPVRAKLELCNMFWRDFVAGPDSNPNWLDHKNNRRCGEVMAFHQYYQVHDQDIAKIDPKARVTTIYKSKDGYDIIPPCGTDDPNRWGCDFLLSPLFGEHAIVTYLDKTTPEQDYDLTQLAGGVSIDQIESCVQGSGS